MAGPRKVQSKPIIVDAYRMPTADEIFLAGKDWENLINEAANWIVAQGNTQYELFDNQTGKLYFYTPLGLSNVDLGSWIINAGKGIFESMADEAFWNRYRDLPSPSHNPKPLPVPPTIPEPEAVMVNDGFVNPILEWASGAPRYRNDLGRYFEAMQIPAVNPDVAEKDMEENYRAIAKWLVNLQCEVDFDRQGNFEIMLRNAEMLKAEPLYWIVRDQDGDFFTRTDRVFRDEYIKEADYKETKRKKKANE